MAVVIPCNALSVKQHLPALQICFFIPGKRFTPIHISMHVTPSTIALMGEEKAAEAIHYICKTRNWELWYEKDKVRQLKDHLGKSPKSQATEQDLARCSHIVWCCQSSPPFSRKVVWQESIHYHVFVATLKEMQGV